MSVQLTPQAAHLLKISRCSVITRRRVILPVLCCLITVEKLGKMKTSTSLCSRIIMVPRTVVSKHASEAQTQWELFAITV